MSVGHAAQVAPPQSMPVSSWFFVPSLQVAVTVTLQLPLQSMDEKYFPQPVHVLCEGR